MRHHLKLLVAAVTASAFLTNCAGGSSTPATPLGIQQTSHTEKHDTSPCPCLYATNLDSSTSSLTVYAAGATGNVKPIQTIKGDKTQFDAWGIAVDGSSNIYAANFYENSVTVYAAGSDGDVKPIQVITGDNTGLDSPEGIAINPVNNDIYVANNAGSGSSDGGTVTVYGPGANGNVAPLATIGGLNTGLSAPNSLTLDASGNVYVSNNSTVTVYAAGSTGNVAPMRTISGKKTKLIGSSQLVLDASSNLYVANRGGPKEGYVTVYANGASGNVAPIRELNGGHTKMHAVWGIALDGSENIYVSNLAGLSGGFVTEYAAGATGNVAPINTIKGSKTGMDNMRSIAIR